MSTNENINSNKFLELISKANSSKLFWILSFSVLTAVAAQITVPVKPVPFTLQTMIVVLAGAFLGAKNGAYSQIIYLILGCIGLPVFAQIPDPAIGIARLLGPTGGYLLAFPIAAFVTGYLIEKNKKYLRVVASMFSGSIIILIIGSFYFGSIYLHNIKEALISGAVVFSVWEVVKVFAAASIFWGISKRFSKMPNK